MTLKGKTTLITGGTGALGQVVAERFVQEGAHVASSYLHEKELGGLPESLRQNVFTVRADVTEESEVAALFGKIIEQFRKVDILINLVGGFLPAKPVRNLSVAEWENMLHLNLKSVFLCSREYLRRGEETSYGRIISMAAMPALKPSAGRAPYAVSKSGVALLTQVLAAELKGSSTTANALAPSIIRTRANMESMPEDDFSNWVAPEDIADMMVFLCSDGGRSISGACIPMYGGV